MSVFNLAKTKEYRIWYFIFILTAVIGMIICLFVYKYTDYFPGDSICIGKFSPLSKSDLFKRYATEISTLSVIFLLGFTVFSLFGSVIYSLYRGFMCGYSALTLAALYEADGITLLRCILFLVCTSIIPAFEICICAKSRIFSMSLENTVPSITKIVLSPKTHRYCASFLFIGLIIFIITFITTIL